MDRVVFLGTNGWFDTETGNTLCLFVEIGGFRLVLDAGNGIHKLDRYADENAVEPIYLFLSHFHLDHVVGVHVLSKFRLAGGMVIGGPEGTREHLGALMRPPFTKAPEDIPYPLALRELPAEAGLYPFPVETLPLLHTGLTLGYRIRAGGKVLAYCPDTGFCENAVTLARGADLLVTECAYGIGVRRPQWPHLNPGDAARIASEAGARKLALVHFDPRHYPTLEHRRRAEEAAGEEFPATVAAVDGLEVEF